MGMDYLDRYCDFSSVLVHAFHRKKTSLALGAHGDDVSLHDPLELLLQLVD